MSGRGFHVLYFAWVRERIGRAEEWVEPPPGIDDVGALARWLSGQSAGHAAALADLDVVRVAVNQDHARADHKLAPGDEIAFFPPVTGGLRP